MKTFTPILFIILLVASEVVIAQPNSQRIWGLCIGISKYPSSGLILKWADRDAISFSTFLKYDLQLPENQYYLLKNRYATRDNILKHLETLNSRATNQDRIYIFYAGYANHLSPILPYDSHHLITLEDISLILKRNKAREIIIFADTSYYGKLTSEGADVSVEQKKMIGWNRDMINKIAKIRKNIIIMSVANEAQSAYMHKTTDLKNGQFTHYLLDTLYQRQQKADTDYDGKLTLYELYQDIALFLDQKSPSLNLQLSSREMAEETVLASEIIHTTNSQSKSTLKKVAIGVGSIAAIGGGIALMANKSNNATQNTSLPDLIISAVYPYFFNSKYIEFRYVIENTGIAPAVLDENNSQKVTLEAVLSADTTINNADDVFLSKRLLPQFPKTGLASGNSFDGRLGVFATIDILKTPYLILMIDSDRAINESDETNNITIKMLER